MRVLTDADILRVCELGEDKPVWYRALLLLSPALPDLKQTEIAAFSLGERNAHLFALRERLSGPRMDAFVRCAACGEPLEFQMDVSEFCEGYVAPGPGCEYDLELDSVSIRYRLLDSRDVAAVAPGEVEGLIGRRRSLVARSVLKATESGRPVDATNLSETAVAAIADELARHDPLADQRLTLSCAACGHTWAARFDIVSFLWSEIEMRAKTLIQEVRTLARAFGWSETEILSMSNHRRRSYLGSLG